MFLIAASSHNMAHHLCPQTYRNERIPPQETAHSQYTKRGYYYLGKKSSMLAPVPQSDQPAQYAAHYALE